MVKMAKMKTGRCGENLQRLFLWKKEDGQMPRKPKKPCAYPGCPNLTDGRYCPEHQSKENCSVEYGGTNPHDDLMEHLLSARKRG